MITIEDKIKYKIKELVKWYDMYGIENSISKMAEEIISGGNIRIIIEARQMYKNKIEVKDDN